MPTVTLNRKVVEKLVGKKLPINKLKDRISMLGTDLEQIDDEEIIVEIFPNRPDMLSEQGFGRALSSFIGVNTGLRKYKVKKSGEKVIVSKDMEKVRPYTVCAIVKNLKLDDEKVRELIQIQEKLHVTFCRKRNKAAIGIYPMEKIKMPIYFCARKPKDIVFRPLEWKKEIDASEILEQHPTGIEYKHLVQGLDKYAIFHDAEDNILSFTPIINSHLTGKITDKTKEAFVEVSGFDLHTAEYVLNILMTAMADMGAEIYSMEVVYPDKTIVTPDLSAKKMKINLKYINKWLGLELSEKEIKRHLERMGYGYKDKKVLVPAYRADVLHQVDLAEDIAISYGYENFKANLSDKSTIAKEDDFEKFRQKVISLLTGLDLLETSSYHLSSKEVQFEKMNFDYDNYVRLENSMSEDFKIMRFWMLPNLMKILSENSHNEYPQNIFESGTVFSLVKKEDTGVKEQNRVAVLLCNSQADYTKARQILDYILHSLGLESKVKETEHPSFIPGRVSRVSVKKKDVAYLGEIHPSVLENFDIEMPVAGFELNLSEIFGLLD